MATLTNDEVLKRIVKPKYGDEIRHLQDEFKELRSYITGKDAKNYLPPIPQFEREELRHERLKMMLSNVDLLGRVLKPRNRIFSAKGGVEHFIIEDQAKERRFRNYIDNIAHGLSLKSWIQSIAIRRNDYDPNGIVMIEVDYKGRCYPSFKSIMNIHDRELDGRTPEYLILKLTKQEVEKLKKAKIIPYQYKDSTEIFRCIDDTTDRIATKEKIINTKELYSAPVFPGIVSSNIYGDEEGIFYSPLNEVKGLLKQYLLRSSIYNVVLARQGFPKEWMQKMDCINCDATGLIDGQTCPECQGTKVMLSQKHSDVMIIDYGDENNKNIPHAPMGNVEASVETLEFFENNIEQREDKIHYNIWGMYKSDKISSIHAGVTRDTIGSNIEPTAYQAMLNAQPMVTQLVEYSKWYVGIYKFAVDIIGSFLFKDSYHGSAILGGDRFMIESPDATWDRYLKAVKSIAPMSELDSILIEYIENKYCNNPLLYRKYMLLLAVEPFLHYPLKDVLEWNIPYVQKMEKIYFDEWKTSLSDWEFTSIADGLDELIEVDEVDKEENDDDEDDAENVDDSTKINQGTKDSKIEPIQNLKKSLREYTLKKIKEDENVLKAPIIDSVTGLPIEQVQQPIVPTIGKGTPPATKKKLKPKTPPAAEA